MYLVHDPEKGKPVFRTAPDRLKGPRLARNRDGQMIETDVPITGGSRVGPSAATFLARPDAHPRGGDLRPRAHFPVKAGLRFSMNAVRPST